ncbi:MAG TPA: hypothetical protein VFC03_13430, partial [Acidimicrobiales bacterium]|nr:hypothetical protein [Acidimicrobiales bacterium]
RSRTDDGERRTGHRAHAHTTVARGGSAKLRLGDERGHGAVHGIEQWEASATPVDGAQRHAPTMPFRC